MACLDERHQIKIRRGGFYDRWNIRDGVMDHAIPFSWGPEGEP